MYTSGGNDGRKFIIYNTRDRDKDTHTHIQEKNEKPRECVCIYVNTYMPYLYVHVHTMKSFGSLESVFRIKHTYLLPISPPPIPTTRDP